MGFAAGAAETLKRIDLAIQEVASQGAQPGCMPLTWAHDSYHWLHVAGCEIDAAPGTPAATFQIPAGPQKGDARSLKVVVKQSEIHRVVCATNGKPRLGST